MANTPGKARTCDLRFRKASLYPTELRGRSSVSLRLEMGFAKLILVENLPTKVGRPLNRFLKINSVSAFGRLDARGGHERALEDDVEQPGCGGDDEPPCCQHCAELCPGA
jgi:hypothetical protein